MSSVKDMQSANSALQFSLLQFSPPIQSSNAVLQFSDIYKLSKIYRLTVSSAGFATFCTTKDTTEGSARRRTNVQAMK